MTLDRSVLHALKSAALTALKRALTALIHTHEGSPQASFDGWMLLHWSISTHQDPLEQSVFFGRQSDCRHPLLSSLYQHMWNECGCVRQRLPRFLPPCSLSPRSARFSARVGITNPALTWWQKSPLWAQNGRCGASPPGQTALLLITDSRGRTIYRSNSLQWIHER